MKMKNSAIRSFPKDIHINSVTELDARRLTGLVQTSKGCKTVGKMEHLWPLAVVFEYTLVYTLWTLSLADKVSSY